MPKKVATPLPPLKPSQAGKRWPRKAPIAASPPDLRQIGPDRLGGQHRRGALGRVEQQGRRRQPLAAGPQHVGRADIARADRADVAEPGDPGQHQPERDRAQHIAEHKAEYRRKQDFKHHGQPPAPCLAMRENPRNKLRQKRWIPLRVTPAKAGAHDHGDGGEDDTGPAYSYREGVHGSRPSPG